jgi:hypothetical protein
MDTVNETILHIILCCHCCQISIQLSPQHRFELCSSPILILLAVADDFPTLSCLQVMQALLFRHPPSYPSILFLSIDTI